MHNWQLDNIDFEQYGVKVTRSRGVLDMPRMLNDGWDWLDENGKDYWHLPSNTKYGDHEIILDCYIAVSATESSSAYNEFVTKLAAFYTAITSPEQKILTTPYGEIPYVSLQQRIELPKRSQYIKSRQIGIFTLRLTVSGDSAFSLLTIAHSSGGYPAAFVRQNNLTVHRRLQGECYATCSFDSNIKLTIGRFDKIHVKFRGASTDTFYLDKDPEVRKLSTNKYLYNLKFEHESNMLKNVAFLLNSEAEFYWFANLEEIIDLIIENTGRVFSSNLYQKGNIAETTRKNHKFTCETCWQVLQRVVAEYEMEWSFNKHAIYGFYFVNVATRIAREWPYTLEYGRGKGLYELTRDAINTEELCTTLFAYGSEKNLPANYGRLRLECPGNPLTANTHIFGVVENIKIFEDIFPNRSGTVSAYTQILKVPVGHAQYAAYESISEVWPGGLFRLEDNTLDFDINQYLRGGLTAKVRMKSGDLAGFEFEIEKYDHALRSMYLLRFKDERGELYPNEVLTIRAGDEYTLVDISQPEDYIEDAESALLSAALDYLEEYSVPKVTYRVVVDPAFIQNRFANLPEYQGFDVGDKIAIIDADLGLYGQYRVSELSKNFHTGRYELRLSENKLLTQREVINHRLNTIERSLQDTKKDEVEQMRKDKETTAELRGRVFDPQDNMQALDRTVRNESIDPRMLAFDSGTVQFQLIGCLAETPYKSDVNKIHISSGYIEVLNWPDNTLPRYDIWKLDGAYDPRRIWAMDETVITLPDNDGYYLIARLPRDVTISIGDWIVADHYIGIKADARYIQYTVGYINMAESPRFVSMLWGNVKVSADQITEAIDPRILAWGKPYYLHNQQSDIVDTLQLLTQVPTGELTTLSQIAGSTTGDVLIAQFATNSLGVTKIPAGVWLFESFVAVNTLDKSKLVMTVAMLHAEGNETALFSVEMPVKDVVVSQHFAYTLQNSFECKSDDVVVVRYYHRNPGAATTLHLMFEGNAPQFIKHSNVRIPIPEGVGKNTEHNEQEGLQGGKKDEYYHHTENEYSNHIYDAPRDGAAYARQDGNWVEIIKHGAQLSEINREFCVTEGYVDVFVWDLYATKGYKISHAILESDGILYGCAIKIDGVPVAGLNNMDISSVTVFTATNNNVVAQGSKITLETSVNFSGTPTVLRGKIVME